IVAGVVVLVTPFGQRLVYDALLVALALVFAIRLAVVMAVSHRRAVIAWIPASIQTVTAALLLFVYSGTLRYLEFGGPLAQAYFARPEEAPAELLGIVPEDFLLLGLMCLVYSFGVWGLVMMVDRPWRRNLGVSGFDFLRGFIGYVAEGSRELEEFFETIGEEAVVPVTVFALRRADGSEKARFVVPMIHPGPMGEIGGGNLPARVAAEAEGLAFVPHATAGHDFNLVTEREVEEVLAAADRAMEQVDYHDSATESRRVDSGEASVLGQAFGDDLFLVATFAPGFADDVMYGVGLSAAAEARVGGFERVMLADAHNSNDGIEGSDDLGHVHSGSARAFDLMDASGTLGRSLADAPREPLRLGTAWDPTPWTPAEGIASLGIRAAVFEVGDQRTAYVVIDGNNMEPGLRGRIVDAVDDADDVEVMTTDNHAVTTVESENQVGARIPKDELVERVVAVVDEAISDAEPVEGGMAVEYAEVTVFGSDRTETLASHANAVLSMGGGLVATVVLAAMAISILIFFLA
ncbi:MAG TPA: DUF2070 family protein, partial [Halobacteriales archaeon]|nr:DUF2070 family protein [Halobacteriales archaeon]